MKLFTISLVLLFSATILSLSSAKTFAATTYGQTTSCKLNYVYPKIGKNDNGQPVVIFTFVNYEADNYDFFPTLVSTSNSSFSRQGSVQAAGTNTAARKSNDTPPGSFIEFYFPVSQNFPAGSYVAHLYMKISDTKSECADSPQQQVVDIPNFSTQQKVVQGNIGQLTNQVTKYNSLGALITAALPNVFAFAAMLAFLFILYGGVRYAMARGDIKATESARSTITNSLIGLVIILTVFTIFEIITNVFKFTLGIVLPTSGFAQSVDIGCAVRLGNQCIRNAFPSFGSLVTAIASFATGLVGVIFVFMLIWGGIRYMLSRGDEKEVSNARNIITSAAIGLLIVIGAFAIIGLIGYLTGQNLLP